MLIFYVTLIRGRKSKGYGLPEKSEHGKIELKILKYNGPCPIKIILETVIQTTTIKNVGISLYQFGLRNDNTAYLATVWECAEKNSQEIK